MGPVCKKWIPNDEEWRDEPVSTGDLLETDGYTSVECRLQGDPSIPGEYAVFGIVPESPPSPPSPPPPSPLPPPPPSPLPPPPSPPPPSPVVEAPDSSGGDDAPIVAGVVGGFAVVVGIGGGFYLYKKQQKRTPVT